MRRALAVLLLALAPTLATAAPLTLPELVATLQAGEKTLPDDPFDPTRRESARQALLRRHAGKEVRMPAPAAPLARHGNRQGLWPLAFEGGRLTLEFWPDQALLFGPQLADSPLAWWRSDREGKGEGRRASDGDGCRSYHERSGIAIASDRPARVDVFVDDRYLGDAQLPQFDYQNGGVRLSFASSRKQAQALARKLDTYVQLDSLYGLQPGPAGEVRASAYRDCYGGEQTVLRARVGLLRVVDRSRGEDLLRLKLRY